MNRYLLSPSALLLLAAVGCYSETTPDDGVDELETQLTQMSEALDEALATIETLQGEVDQLASSAASQAELDEALAAFDTLQGEVDQLASNSASQAVLDEALASIDTLQGEVTALAYSSASQADLDEALATIELLQVELTDLAASGASQAEVDGLVAALADLEAAVSMLDAASSVHDARIVAIEDSYVQTSSVEDVVRLIDADETWSVADEGELADAIALLDGYRIAHDTTVTIELAAGTYAFTEPLAFRHADGDRVEVVGAGSSSTILHFTGTDGVVVDGGAVLGLLTELSIMGDGNGDWNGLVAEESSHIGLGTVDVSYFGGRCVLAQSESSIVADDILYVSDCGVNGVQAHENSFVSAEYAEVSNCGSSGFSASGGSGITATDSSSDGNTYYGYISSTSAYIGAYYSTSSSNGLAGFLAYKGGTLGARYSEASGNPKGYYSWLGSFLDAHTTNSSSASSYDYYTLFNSSIIASDASGGTTTGTSSNDTTDWVYGL